MEKKEKIILTVVATVILIGGLFLLRGYLSDKYDISADISQEVESIFQKQVEDGEFNDDQFTNITKEGNALVLESETTEICGNAPNTKSAGVFQGGDATLELKTFSDSEEEEWELHQQYPSYFLDGKKKDNISTKSFDLNSTNAELEDDNYGFSIVRRPGWLYLQLDDANEETFRNSAKGTLTFPKEVTFPEQMILNYEGDNGVENYDDGEIVLESSNDEIDVDRESKTIDFSLITDTRNDQFYINYCMDTVENKDGEMSGTIDLGSKKPLSNLELGLTNYDKGNDEITIEAKISKDGTNWEDINPETGTTLTFQDPMDSSDCYRYIDYTISIVSPADRKDPLSFEGLSVYGGDECLTGDTAPTPDDGEPISDDSEPAISRLISTGPSFWLIIAIVVLISGLITVKISMSEEKSEE